MRTDHADGADGADAPLELAAGTFSSWLAGMERALRGEQPSHVPCGTCTACCTSSQFVHIAPDETATLSRIPQELRFPAPGLPEGHVVLGYDQQGHCPMFRDGGCSIYDHRPRTCRTYDCRIFPATGVVPEPDGLPAIARQARRWRFTADAGPDRPERAAPPNSEPDNEPDGEPGGPERAALRAAAAYLLEHHDRLPLAGRPANATQLAVLAVEVHDLFIRHDHATGRPSVVSPAPGVVEAAIRSRSSPSEISPAG